MAQQSSSKNNRGRKRRRNADNGFEVWGGYMAAKISKLDGQVKKDAGSSNAGIFSGIAIFVNGYTEPSGEELKRIMLSNGGTFHHYYSRRRTTHIIASNLPHTKVRHLDTDRIVKASWIVESLAAGRLLDYSKYLLYTDQSSVQPKISFSKVEKPTLSSGYASTSSAECSSAGVIKSENKDNFTGDIIGASLAASETGIKNNGEVKQCPNTLASVQSTRVPDLPESDELASNCTSCPTDAESCESKECFLNAEQKLRAPPSMAGTDVSRVVFSDQSTTSRLPEPHDGDLFADEASIVDNCINVASVLSSVSAPFKIGVNVSDNRAANSSSSCTNCIDGSDNKHVNKTISCRIENHVSKNTLHEKSSTQDGNVIKCAGTPSKDCSTNNLTNTLNLEDHEEQLEDFNTVDGAGKCSERVKSENETDRHVQSTSSNSRLCSTVLYANVADTSGAQLLETEQKCEQSNIVEKTIGQNLKSNMNSSKQKSISSVEYDYPSNTSNPNFLTDFYNKSRLHHISTMGAMFKEYVTKLMKKPPDNSGKLRFKQWLEEHQHSSRETTSKLQRALATHSENADFVRITTKPIDRLIMHIDMDCFFVSVGLRNRPELMGLPVAVTHAKGNRTNKRPGADIDAEFQLYRDRQSKKHASRNVDQKIATKIRELDESKRAFAGVVNEDMADNDEGYEAWSDIDGQEEATLLEVLEQVENKTTADGTDVNKPREIKPENTSSGGNSSCDKEKTKAGKRGTSLLDSTSSLAEIASCSYEARQAGVTNGMFLGAALKLCPQLRTIPYDFEGYKEVSYQLYDIVASYTRSIEAVSCDELYADVSDVVRELRDSHGASPELLAACVRHHVTSITQCGCSAGMGNSKLSARLATKLAKPHGHVYLDHLALLQHLTPLPLRDLPGVGWSVSDRLRKAGAETCGELRAWSLPRLEGLCGPRTAATLLNFCNGIDDRPINSHHVRKSVSAEVNYGIRFERELDAKDFLRQLCEEVSNRLKAIDLIGRCICLKLKIRCKDAPRETAKFMGHGVCDNVAKSVSLLQPTDDPQILLRESLKLLAQVKAAWCDYRGVGLQVSRLEAKSELGVSPASAITKFLVKKSKEEVLACEQQLSKKASETDQPRETKRVTAMEKFVKAKTTNPKNMGNSKVVDVDVLLALPPDLREQVIAEYKQQGYIVPSMTEVSLGTGSLEESEKKVAGSAVLKANSLNRGTNGRTKLMEDIDLQTPGPSGYKAPRPQGANHLPASNSSSESGSGTLHDSLDAKLYDRVTAAACDSSDVRSVERSSTAADLQEDADEGRSNSPINMSQIDSSFLCALPEDLQEELKRDYQRQKRVMHGLTSPKKLLELSPSKLFAVTPPRGSPKKQRGRQGGSGLSSPRRPPANHTASPPRRGKRRGRPPKWDTRRADSGRHLNKASVGGSKEVQVASPSDQVEVDSPSLPLDAVPLAPTPSHPSVPSLCGESSLASVRSLIKEWLQSCPVPGDEDCAILSDYFCDLAVARQLEMMDCLVKLLYRKIGQLSGPCSTAWRVVYASLLKRLQTVMIREYGAPLQVCTFDSS